MLQVVRLGEVGPPNLHKERPAEIQELVLLVFGKCVCLWLEVIRRLLDWTQSFASFSNKSRTVGDRSQSANNESIQHVIHRVRMVMFREVRHDCTDVLARIST